jgi:ankyrin repeat protein
VFESLAQLRADINRADDVGRTALHLAVLGNFKNVVQALVTAKVKTNIVDGSGQTALAIAKRKKFDDIVDLLEKSSMKGKDDGRQSNSSRSGRDRSRDRGRDDHRDHHGRRDRSQMNRNDDPNELFKDIPHRNSLFNDERSVTVSESDQFIALQEAVKLGDLQLVQRLVGMLIDCSQEIDKNTRQTIIHLACMDSKTRRTNANIQPKIVEAILDSPRPVNVNAYDALGRTPLLLATVKGNKVVMDILIERKADTNASDILGQTALRFAATANYSDIVASLVAAAADVNQQSKDGQTAIIEAARGGYVRILQTLVLSGANVNHQNTMGGTALHEIARRGHYRVVSTLVAAKANPRIENKKGESALELARQQSDKRVFELLKVVPATPVPPPQQQQALLPSVPSMGGNGPPDFGYSSPMADRFVPESSFRRSIMAGGSPAHDDTGRSKSVIRGENARSYINQKRAQSQQRAPATKNIQQQQSTLSPAEEARLKLERKKQEDMLAFRKYKEIAQKRKQSLGNRRVLN